MILLLLACTDASKPDDSATTPTSLAEFGVLADQIPGGTLLSAWSDGDVVRMVGGQLDGSAGVMVAYDGTSLCTDDSFDAALWWINGATPGDWYAVGARGTIVHSVDGVRSDESVATEATLYGVYVDGDVVWAVGGDATANTGQIWRKASGAWSLYASTPATVFKVWDGWFVGNGYVAWLDGDTLVDRTPPDRPRLLTVRGRSDTDVWAVGGDAGPIVKHWDGTEWTDPEVDPYCVSRPMNGVWTAPDSPVWFAGMFGNVGGLDGDTWICPDYPPTQEHFHAAWPHGDEVLFLGGNLFETSGNYGTIVRHPAPVAPLTTSPCP